jgi:hypothetical protein
MAEAEGLLAAAGVCITPADIAKVFMGDGVGAAALRKLLDELRRRRDGAAAAANPKSESTSMEWIEKMAIFLSMEVVVDSSCIGREKGEAEKSWREERESRR